MARKRTRLAAVPSSTAARTGKQRETSAPKRSASEGWSELFSRVACVTARWMGKPITFLIAAALVVIWAATGPLFHYSDTWQLVINTSTTIVTFLMVFLIQNTQNRDTMALQLKVSELILCLNEAENRFASAEDLSDKELEDLHKELQQRAEKTIDTLEERRAKQKKAS